MAEKAPHIGPFEIIRASGEKLEIHGNTMFCHEPKVRAFVEWAARRIENQAAEINRLAARCSEYERRMEQIRDLTDEDRAR